MQILSQMFSLSEFMAKAARTSKRSGLPVRLPRGSPSESRTSIAHEGALVSGAMKVTVRLRGDFGGMVHTTSITFHALDGLGRQIDAALNRHFGAGAIGIATPTGKVVTEDYQIYRLRYPGYSYTFCNVVYDRGYEDQHPPITIPSQKILLEVADDDIAIDGGERIRYLDPGFNYNTTYTDHAGLSITKPEQHQYQQQLAVQRGDYCVPHSELPSYECVPQRRISQRVGDACFSCVCCRNWIAHILEEYGGQALETMASRGPSNCRPARRRALISHRVMHARDRPLRARDFDGLSLEQRRMLVRARGGVITA
ncbi:hypothetical protein L873DRAFT_516067 [Choiromyces venosus 120613-1]|uniref:Uncharacterized protein n=1 Tax=Choiromyces venosus 120613-1 TaxID=1336337 RepID=A0A3N4K7Y5_9PEZI|nr:hypothetical protein L873DRAFT_48523 [Choiromyces venosus 120613-1]RPB05568.1 hypothetical protein L873DRAFT_516067 [Choiromyces venosus 120613-1]